MLSKVLGEPCFAGTLFNESTGNCSLCPKGTFQTNFTTNQSCSHCDACKYSTGLGMTSCTSALDQGA